MGAYEDYKAGKLYAPGEEDLILRKYDELKRLRAIEGNIGFTKLSMLGVMMAVILFTTKYYINKNERAESEQAISLVKNPSQLDYIFNGYIDGEHVRFYEEEGGRKNVLRVVRKNGVIMTFVDRHSLPLSNLADGYNTWLEETGDLKKIETLLVYDPATKVEQTYFTAEKDDLEGIMKEGQEQFEDYLKDILEYKKRSIEK